jgi:hypothetical protein
MIRWLLLYALVLWMEAVKCDFFFVCIKNVRIMWYRLLSEQFGGVLYTAKLSERCYVHQLLRYTNSNLLYTIGFASDSK